MADIDITMSCAWQVAQTKPLKMADLCKMQNEAISFLSVESVDTRRFRERSILAGYCFEMHFETCDGITQSDG